MNEQGNLDPDGELIRWIAERPKEGSAWRGVDIAVGGVAGRPGWTTVVELSGCSDQGITASPTSRGRPVHAFPRTPRFPAAGLA